MNGPPTPRHPLLAAPIRGLTAAWLWRRIRDEAPGAPAALAMVAGERAGVELAHALAELREAARQWEERARVDRADDTRDGTPERAAAGRGRRSPHELTANEAADVLGVSPELVRRWCRAGRLTARRTRGAWQITRTSVEDLHAERRNAA